MKHIMETRRLRFSSCVPLPGCSQEGEEGTIVDKAVTWLKAQNVATPPPKKQPPKRIGSTLTFGARAVNASRNGGGAPGTPQAQESSRAGGTPRRDASSAAGGGDPTMQLSERDGEPPPEGESRKATFFQEIGSALTNILSLLRDPDDLDDIEFDKRFESHKNSGYLYAKAASVMRKWEAISNAHIKKLRAAETRNVVHLGTMLQKSAGQVVLAALVKHETVGAFAATMSVGMPRWQVVFMIFTAVFSILVVGARGGGRFSCTNMHFCLLFSRTLYPTAHDQQTTCLSLSSQTSGSFTRRASTAASKCAATNLSLPPPPRPAYLASVILVLSPY